MTQASPSIRSHLARVLLVCIVPVGLFGAGMLYLHWKAQEAERERSQMESVRVLAAAVDNALDSTAQRLTIFAKLLGSGGMDYREVYAQATAALQASADWDNMLLWTADGKGVFRLDRPLGQDLESMRLLHHWRPVVDERRVVVSNVFTSPFRDVKVVGVAVPVVRGDKVTHILMGNIRFTWFDELLRKQGLPESAVAGIFDREWKFVARSSDGPARRGTEGAPALVADMKKAHEGIGRYASLDSVEVYTAWATTRHGWHVAYATPTAPIDAAFWRHLAGFGLLWLAAVAAGILYALRKGRMISGSLLGLERSAGMLARGHELSRRPASRVLEVDRALSALEEASAVVAAAIRDRERALSIEREARTAAEEANRAKDAFLAMLSHELRNPVGAISNAVGILRSGERTDEEAAFAGGVIARQSQHLRRLIDDLLDVGRAITGKIAIERAPVELAASARHAVSALDASGRLAERELSVEASPVWVVGDATRIEQILTNLLVNAANHTAPGGRIRIEVAQEGDAARVRVSDDGAGIAPAHLPRLFDLFFQGDTSVERDKGGLGIGLTLAKRLAELHGGTVSAESEGPGRGSRFTVRLPAVSASADAGLRAQGPEIRPMSLI